MLSKAHFEVLMHQRWQQVSVKRSDRLAVIELPGRRLTVDFAEVEPGCYSLIIDGCSYDATVRAADGKYLVSVNGASVEVLVRDPKKLKTGSVQSDDNAGPMPVTAPMPGKVVKLLVGQGQRVAEGQGVAVIEAMKMQNELKAPKSGTVERVQVGENQAVNAGDSLMIVK